MCGKRGQRETGEGNRQRNVFGSQMLSPFCRIIMSHTLYFFHAVHTHTHTHISICWGIGQFGTNMLIVYFLFIFSKKKNLWDTFFYTRTSAASRPERRGDFDVSEPAQYSAPRTGSPFLNGKKPAAVLPRRRALHLISHLHRKHQMVNRLAISPGGGALASYLNPTCPLALPKESPADVREISLSAGFKSPKSLHILWNKTSAHCGPNVA